MHAFIDIFLDRAKIFRPTAQNNTPHKKKKKKEKKKKEKKEEMNKERDVRMKNK